MFDRVSVHNCKLRHRFPFIQLLKESDFCPQKGDTVSKLFLSEPSFEKKITVKLQLTKIQPMKDRQH